MQKKVGRPPSTAPLFRPFQMKVPEEFLVMVDEWRRQQPDLPSRAEAIRRMVAMVVGKRKK